jgi:hypothetical protein
MEFDMLVGIWVNLPHFDIRGLEILDQYLKLVFVDTLELVVTTFYLLNLDVKGTSVGA